MVNDKNNVKSDKNHACGSKFEYVIIIYVHPYSVSLDETDDATEFTLCILIKSFLNVNNMFIIASHKVYSVIFETVFN